MVFDPEINIAPIEKTSYFLFLFKELSNYLTWNGCNFVQYKHKPDDNLQASKQKRDIIYFYNSVTLEINIS